MNRSRQRTKRKKSIDGYQNRCRKVLHTSRGLLDVATGRARCPRLIRWRGKGNLWYLESLPHPPAAREARHAPRARGPAASRTSWGRSLSRHWRPVRHCCRHRGRLAARRAIVAPAGGRLESRRADWDLEPEAEPDRSRRGVTTSQVSRKPVPDPGRTPQQAGLPLPTRRLAPCLRPCWRCWPPAAVSA